jgi:uncharacterized protein (TIGR03067 family)
MRASALLITAVALSGSVCGAGDKNDDLRKKHLAHYEGRWQCTGGYTFNGKPIPKADAEKLQLTVEGTSFTIVSGADNMTIKGTFKLDPTKKPPAIDVFLENSPKDNPIRGIYEIVDADTRRSCLAIGGPRPERFVKEAKFITLEWKRIPEKAGKDK